MSKEYTVLAVISTVITVVLHRLFKARLFRRFEFWAFWMVILFFKALMNGVLTGKNIVQYDSRFYLGIRIGTIPVEDFLFGFSMVTLTIILWEYQKRKELRK